MQETINLSISNTPFGPVRSGHLAGDKYFACVDLAKATLVHRDAIARETRARCYRVSPGQQRLIMVEAGVLSRWAAKQHDMPRVAPVVAALPLGIAARVSLAHEASGMPQLPRNPANGALILPPPVRVTCTIGPVSIPDVLVLDGDAWLTQAEIGALFGVHKETVREHICGILEEGECKPDATTRNFLAVRSEGSRQVQREVTHYSSDMVLAVGYRVRSSRGVEFRQWVSRVVKGEAPAPAASPSNALVRGPKPEDFVRLVGIVETLSARVDELQVKQLPAASYEALVESAVADRFDELEARLARLEAPKPEPKPLPALTLVRPQTRPRFADWFAAQAAKRGVLRKDCGRLLQRAYAALAADYEFDVYKMRGENTSVPLWSVAVSHGYEDELFECGEKVLKGLDRVDAAG